jgi:glyoxylase-like metal-dependent hydrolase (beta-lactamase superfamily II)
MHASHLPVVLDRRAFLADLGRGAFALAIVGIAGCSPSSLATLAPTPGAPTSAGPSPSTRGPGATGTPVPPPAASPLPGGLRWTRVFIENFVSAYVVVRGGEAAVVDTGTFDSTADIEAALRGLGLDWSALGHVIVTHHHQDHAGSLGRILERAPAATAYMGPGDIPAMGSGIDLTPVGDGDTVLGLQIVATPGHTPGHICAFDPLAGVMLTGDALRTDGGLPVPPGSSFTANMAQAQQSIVKLGGLTFEVLLPGHGEPIESGASALVAELGASF